MAPTATLLRPASFSELANLCGNLSYGLAMRYHVALAMLRCGLPVKLIAYDTKVAGLAAEANIELLSNNQLSGFKTADHQFFVNNLGRYKTMQKAFKEFITRP
jgi:polysaccharide pyruvyl transferase WcaK-like protein